MDAVPEEVGVGRLEGRGAVGEGAVEVAVLGALEGGERVETERGGTEDGDLVLLGQAEDLERVAQGAGDGLVDEHRLAGGEDFLELREMRAAVDRLDHDGVDVAREFGDGFVELDVRVLEQIGGVAVDARGAGGDVGAAALEHGDDLGAGDVVLVGGVVQRLGEGDHVRRIEADETDAQIGRAGGAGEQGAEGEAGGAKETGQAHGAGK